MKRKLQIGIIGSAGWEEYPGAKPDKKLYKIAYSLGKAVAVSGAILICGGKGGIMEEACRGSKRQNGTTVGVISGSLRGLSNEFVDVEIVSGMINCAEESIIISMCDGLIAIGGGSGTLQELSLAYRNKKPVVCMKNTGGWAGKVAGTFLDERKLILFKTANKPREAIDILLKEMKMIR